MYAKKPKSRLWVLILALVVLVSALVGVAIGKYIKTQQYDGTLKFNAELAESIQLLESKANRQPDGSYVLDTTNSVINNTYTLIPGLDIPKDPHIVITDKTSIEAYLFVEVKDTTNGAISCKMSGDWKLLEGVTGKKENGVVYVYAKGGGDPTPLTKKAGDTTIYLLENNEITVSQELLHAGTTGGVVFYAAMGEVAAYTQGTAIENAKEIYNNHIYKPTT